MAGKVEAPLVTISKPESMQSQLSSALPLLAVEDSQKNVTDEVTNNVVSTNNDSTNNSSTTNDNVKRISLYNII